MELWSFDEGFAENTTAQHLSMGHEVRPFSVTELRMEVTEVLAVVENHLELRFLPFDVAAVTTLPPFNLQTLAVTRIVEASGYVAVS